MADSAKMTTWMKAQGIALVPYVGYKLVMYSGSTRTKGQFFDVQEMKAISLLTGINEFLFWWFFDQVLGHDANLMKKKNVASKIILGATFFYLSPIVLLSNAKSADYAKYVYALIFMAKCVVGSPWIQKLRLQTTEHAFLFLNLSLALVYGLIAKQLLGTTR